MPELPEFELDLSSPEERAKLMLGTAGILGGGVIGYHIVKSAREGDIFKVDMPEKREETTAQGIANLLVGTLGLVLFGSALRETIKEYGRDNFLIGASVITVGTIVVALIREARS